MKRATFNKRAVTSKFKLLSNTAAQNHDKTNSFNKDSNIPDSDKNNDTTSPTFDSVYIDEGSGAIGNLKYFLRNLNVFETCKMFQGKRMLVTVVKELKAILKDEIFCC